MRPSAIAISTFMQPALSSWPYAEMQNFAPLCCGVASLVANFVNVMLQKSKAKTSFLCPAAVCHQFSLILCSLGIFQLFRSEICQRNFVRVPEESFRYVTVIKKMQICSFQYIDYYTFFDHQTWNYTTEKTLLHRYSLVMSSKGHHNNTILYKCI